MTLKANARYPFHLVWRPWALLALVLAFSLSACVYRLDVQQGNDITAEMISQVSPGMTRRQVVRILGYPLINDPFNQQRWDYFYSFLSGKSRKMESRSATLLFEGDQLVSIESNIPPGTEDTSATE